MNARRRNYVTVALDVQPARSISRESHLVIKAPPSGSGEVEVPSPAPGCRRDRPRHFSESLLEFIERPIATVANVHVEHKQPRLRVFIEKYGSRGAMGLPPMRFFHSVGEHRREIWRRQHVSALYTAARRAIDSKVREAISYFIFTGRRPMKSAVARLVGVNRRSLNPDRWARLMNEATSVYETPNGDCPSNISLSDVLLLDLIEHLSQKQI